METINLSTGLETTPNLVELYSISRAAAKLKIGKNKLYLLIAQGKIKTIDDGGPWEKISHLELLNFVKNEAKITAPPTSESVQRASIRSQSDNPESIDINKIFENIKSQRRR